MTIKIMEGPTKNSRGHQKKVAKYLKEETFIIENEFNWSLIPEPSQNYGPEWFLQS